LHPGIFSVPIQKLPILISSDITIRAIG
jgi:hypothetical protein